MEQDKLYERFLEEVYDYKWYCNTKGDIEAVLKDRFNGDIKLTEKEMQEAVQTALDIQDFSIEWIDFAEEAVHRVLDKRPKEEPKPKPKDPTIYYKELLKMYGLEDGVPFVLKGDKRFIYHFDDGCLLCSEGIFDEEATPSEITLEYFIFNYTQEDIEIVSPKQDLLNDTLRLIGLETNQGFLVDDDEYRGTAFYFDSFGDIYTNGEDEDVYHEYLTLGRILTQYHDKIIPIDKEV